MATANIYAGRFIGNELVLPGNKKQQFKVEAPKEQILSPASVLEPVAPIAWAPTLPKAKPVSRFSILRISSLSIALLFSFGLSYMTYVGLTHNSVLSAVNSTAATLDQRVKDNLHHTPSLINLPSYSLVVKSNDLSSDIENVEAQPISVHLSFASVAVPSSQIAEWIKASPGPVANTTLLSVNSSLLSSYLNSLAKQYDRQPTSEVITTSISGATTSIVTQGNDGISFGGVAAAANQIASKLFSATGANVSLSQTSVPYQTATQ